MIENDYIDVLLFLLFENIKKMSNQIHFLLLCQTKY